MTDEKQAKGGGSKWAIAWTFLAPVGLWRMLRETFRGLRDTVSHSSDAVRSMANERGLAISEWNSTILTYGVDQQRIEREVMRRQVMALIAAMFFLLGLYGLLAWDALLPGFGCAALSALYYLQAALRLHQIRNREFVSISVFFSRVKRNPRELLPLGLPAGWKLFVGNTK